MTERISDCPILILILIVFLVLILVLVLVLVHGCDHAPPRW